MVLQKILQAFLKDSAFNFYGDFDQEVKGDLDNLKGALLKAFSIRPSEAYELFISRKLLLGELMEVLISDLKRSAGLIGIKIMDLDTVEPFKRSQVLRALPNKVSRQLYSALTTKSLSLSELQIWC